MTKQEKYECKKYIKRAKRWYKRFGRGHGAIAFVQTDYNVISELEVAIRYLITKGYHFNLNYGTNKFFRTCLINIQ